jgi:hypothetical protein
MHVRCNGFVLDEHVVGYHKPAQCILRNVTWPFRLSKQLYAHVDGCNRVLVIVAVVPATAASELCSASS